ncbi:MAG TPA: S9 family peptidase [Allosphingosinicella sp.]|nr:S9 family peptidase [Allosphingosinicella sp.]
MGFGVARRLAAACLVIFAGLAPIAPAVAAPPIEAYGQLPGFEDAAISPSGERIAMIGVVHERRGLIVIDKDRNPLAALPVGDAKVRGLSWGGNDRVLVRISQTVSLGPGFLAEKTELSTTLVVPVDGGKPWTVFDKYRAVTGGTRGFYGALERDGRWYGYFGGITLAGGGKEEPRLGSTAAELYEVDLESRKPTRIARRLEDEGGDRDWLLGPDGAAVATLDIYSRSGDWTIRNAGRDVIASGRNRLGNVSLVSLGRTPGTILYSVEDEATGGYRRMELALAGGQPVEILADEEIGGFYTDDRSRLLIGYLEESESPIAHFFDARREKIIRATRKAFPNLNVQLIDSNEAFDRLIIYTDGSGDAGTWWIVDIKTGKADILGSSYPIAPADVGPVSVLRYKAGDGMDLTGVLTLPPGLEAKALPVVVLPHGGPTSRDYPSFDYWAQAFASRGYAVFQPNFRGSSGFGAAFEKAGHGEWGRKMQTDISDGLAALARQGTVDPKRACIMGGSYGGYAALAGVTLQQGLYRCAVSVAGVSDVAKMYRTDVGESGSDPMLIRALKELVGSGRSLAAVSPVNFADKADAPILLIHGKNDTVVLYDQSNDMAAALRRAGKPVEFVTLAGEDHWLSGSATRLAMLKAAVAFVEKHNPPDPAKE